MRTFVIRQPNDGLSERLADECIGSAKKFGIVVEKFDGVYSNHNELIAEEKLFPFPKLTEEKTSKLGFKGCFLSHYMLWKKCIELDTPIMIFEHDALMIRPLPENILELFTHHCILDYAVHEPNYEEILLRNGILKVQNYPKLPGRPSLSKINASHIRGSHAHIVKPAGAKSLIGHVAAYGFLASDATVNRYYTTYITIDPIPVRCHPFFSDKRNRKLYSHTK